MKVQDWLPESVRNKGVAHTLAAGQTLFRVGDATVGLYEIVSGMVRLARINRSGREVVLYTATAGDTIAEASLFGSSYHCDAIATRDSVVRLYPRAAILGEFERHPEVAQRFMAILAQQVMNLRTRLEQRNIRSARERVRQYLDVSADPDNHMVELSGTVKDLAAELGLTHEALYRTLSEMQRDGEIERLNGRIRLVRPV